MNCPRCGSAMTHLGYFTWACTACGRTAPGQPPGEEYRLAPAVATSPAGRQLTAEGDTPPWSWQRTDR
jgi:tRNA(Ile2) C34 agmatinyltransferase TiaS